MVYMGDITPFRPLSSIDCFLEPSIISHHYACNRQPSLQVVCISQLGSDSRESHWPAVTARNLVLTGCRPALWPISYVGLMKGPLSGQTISNPSMLYTVYSGG